jgi:antitoxin component HigA of HigAB toxin-antitoxin module
MNHANIPHLEKPVSRLVMGVDNQTELEREGIASQSQWSNLLAGRREISKGLAKRLAVRFKVPLEMLL